MKNIACGTAGRKPPRRRKSAPGRKATEAVLASWARQQAEDLAAFRKASATAPCRRLVGIEVVDLVDVLTRPELAVATLQAVVTAYATTRGMGGDSMCECHTCCRRWTRAPVAVAVVTTTNPDSRGIGLVCLDCAAGPGARLRQLLIDAVRRDNLLTDGITELTAASFAPGGRA